MARQATWESIFNRVDIARSERLAIEGGYQEPWAPGGVEHDGAVVVVVAVHQVGAAAAVALGVDGHPRAHAHRVIDCRHAPTRMRRLGSRVWPSV